MEITSENWTHCTFSHENLKALITFGASPEAAEDMFVYYVTVLDDGNNELFQREFKSLKAACGYINKKYRSIWTLSDALKPKKEGGCSTCIAH